MIMMLLCTRYCRRHVCLHRKTM